MGSTATILSHSRHYGMARSPGASQAPSYCSMYTQLPVCVPLSTNPKSWGLPDSVCPLRGIAVLLPEFCAAGVCVSFCAPTHGSSSQQEVLCGP